MLGLKWEGEAPGFEVDVWPENWQALQVFLAMGTQWRVVAGMGGLMWLGLDYNVLPDIEQRLGVKDDERADGFMRLRVMEAAAKTELNRAQG